ncbi:hypothetical protein ACJX0J_028302, partial [Zea mays]
FSSQVTSPLSHICYILSYNYKELNFSKHYFMIMSNANSNLLKLKRTIFLLTFIPIVTC